MIEKTEVEKLGVEGAARKELLVGRWVEQFVGWRVERFVGWWVER